MSATGTRVIVWAGGETTFCLAKVGHILDLEDKCKAGIGVITARLESGSYGINDVRETIRLGLIGGGMTPERAMTMVHNHVDANPLAHSVLVAYGILQAVIFGAPQDDPVGKETDQGKAEPAKASEAGYSTETVAFAAPASSQSEPLSDGLPA